MKLIYVLANTGLPAIVAGVAIGLVVEHQARLKLAGEHQILEQQVRQLAGLVARNEQLSNLLAQAGAPAPLPPDQLLELLRLRGAMSVLNRQQTGLDQAREENRQAHAVLERCLQTLTETNAKATADFWPQDSWTNRGYGSPEAALQTLLWAGRNGDLTNFSASLADEGTNELGNAFKGKSAAEISLRLASETYGVQSIQILGRDSPDDHTMSLTVALEDPDGFQNIKMVMKLVGGEWKFAGPSP
jgi:hypothetical protein